MSEGIQIEFVVPPMPEAMKPVFRWMTFENDGLCRTIDDPEVIKYLASLPDPDSPESFYRRERWGGSK